VAAGLTFRPVRETVADTLAWAATRGPPGPGTAALGGTEGVGLAPDREAQLLDEWAQAAAASGAG